MFFLLFYCNQYALSILNVVTLIISMMLEWIYFYLHNYCFAYICVLFSSNILCSQDFHSSSPWCSQIVTTHNFRSFQVISRTLEKHYSSNTIHQNTIHQFTIHRFQGQFDILRNFWEIYYSRNTIHCGKRFHHSRALHISS